MNHFCLPPILYPTAILPSGANATVVTCISGGAGLDAFARILDDIHFAFLPSCNSAKSCCALSFRAIGDNAGESARLLESCVIAAVLCWGRDEGMTTFGFEKGRATLLMRDMYFDIIITWWASSSHIASSPDREYATPVGATSLKYCCFGPPIVWMTSTLGVKTSDFVQ